MADSKRLTILKSLTTQLEAISTTNGYTHNLTGRVFRGRGGLGSETPKPCVGIFEMRPEEAVRADEVVQKDDWFVALQGFCEPDDVHPTDPAHNLMADVKKALGNVLRPGHPSARNTNYMLGGLIADMTVDGGVVFPAEDGSGMAMFLLKLTLKVVDDHESAFT